MSAAGNLNDKQFDPKEYDGHYKRGWSSSARGGNMDRADMRGEPNSWYDGYYDHAAGRAKFHYRDHISPCKECGG